MSSDPFLALAENLARFHREHEKFYARAPLEEAAAVQRTSGALRALAERWSTVDPHRPEAASPFSGAEDLNDERAIELAGIMFMEGEGEPAEITRIKRELEAAAQGNDEAGAWLGSAMETSWGVAENLLRFPALADLLAERHRIISTGRRRRWRSWWRETWSGHEPCSSISTSPRQPSERTSRGIAASPRFSTRRAN